jgi:uncharacterized small protein (DUF1192 family)
MLSSKKHERIEKALGTEVLVDLEALSLEDLKSRIAQADGSIKSTQDELEANPKYEELKESLKALSEGLREVRKRQNAVVTYCLHLIEEKGE